MRKSTQKLLSDWAIAYAKAKFPEPNWEAIAKSPSAQSITFAINIYQILRSCEWITSAEIASKLDKSPSYVRKVLAIVKEPFGLSSDRGKGWKLAYKWHRRIK